MQSNEIVYKNIIIKDVEEGKCEAAVQTNADIANLYQYAIDNGYIAYRGVSKTGKLYKLEAGRTMQLTNDEQWHVIREVQPKEVIEEKVEEPVVEEPIVAEPVVEEVAAEEPEATQNEEVVEVVEADGSEEVVSEEPVQENVITIEQKYEELLEKFEALQTAHNESAEQNAKLLKALSALKEALELV